jgi:hypothetical protein
MQNAAQSGRRQRCGNPREKSRRVRKIKRKPVVHRTTNDSSEIAAEEGHELAIIFKLAVEVNALFLRRQTKLAARSSRHFVQRAFSRTLFTLMESGLVARATG